MKYDLFFKLAKEAGIEESEIRIVSTYALSFSLFHSEVDQYSIDDHTSISARGIINGKFGSASCDSWSKEKARYLVDEIVKNAKVIESTDPAFIYKGSEKYHHVNTYNKNLEAISIDEKMKKLYELEKKIKALDPRIIEVETVAYEESRSSLTIMNSHGLKLRDRNNSCIYYGGAVAKDGEQTKTGGEIFFDNDFSKFNVDEFAKKIVDDTVSKIGGEACASKKYKAVLRPDVVKSLMAAYISSTDAEQVQKKSSLLMDKLHTQVASKKVTIMDMPLAKSLFARSFDDEGVATYNKNIIKKGVLETYLYNLTTAAKDGVKTTGNASKSGSKMGIDPVYLVMKPGKKSQEELFQKMGDGVYITEVTGLHCGLNPQSGNFSLQSTGFIVENGKVGKGLDIITVSGNLMDLFKDVVDVANDTKVFSDGIACPSVMIKKIAVSGK